jgi:hypothetical protein
MSPISNPRSNQDIVLLRDLAAQVDLSSLKAKKSLSGIKGRVNIGLASKLGNMPKNATKYLEIHQQFEKAINAMKEKGEGDKIPQDILNIFQKSKEAVKKIANQVNYSSYLKILNKDTSSYTDETKLLRPLVSEAKNTHSNMKEWELNFGLLHSAYQRTKEEDTKATIRFLMTNYLAKAAYLNSYPATGQGMSESDIKSYQNMLQIGQMTFGGMYHRIADRENPTLRILGLEGAIGSNNEKSADLIPVDSTEIQKLYNVAFVTTPDLSKKEEIVNILVNLFEAHRDQFPKTNMEFPVLIDITAQIGELLFTNGKNEKIKAYEDKQQEVRVALNEIIKIAADAIKQKHPNDLDLAKVSDYLRTNMAVVSRAQVNEHLGVIGLHKNLFKIEDFESRTIQLRNKFITQKVKEWAGLTAVNVGAINFRRVAAETHTNPIDIGLLGAGKGVEYTVSGKADVTMYPKLGDILKTNTFRMLENLVEGKYPNANEGQQLLAKATVGMMHTLLGKISEKDWNDKQNDPIIKELTQNALFRITQHLATAAHQGGNFRQFSQCIDRTHSELTTLLALYAPFDPSSFDHEYKEFLKPIFPEYMEPRTVGVARSAMNVFAGVNSAIIQEIPNPVRICGSHSYYEEVALVGGNRTLEKVLQDPSTEKVDLYVAEFYHNIDIDTNHIRYQKGTVAEDIRNIFKNKPKTDSLTVSIDATIDFTRSEDIKELLKEFQKEITEGKLNFIIFRSGQKFDMMGLDNYFGSPFYIVNNSDKKWDKFSIIKTEEAFKTDPLSEQFFSWITETGPELIDQYKALIFENTRKILNIVPEELAPVQGKEVCVCSFEEGVKTPFIDIKVDMADFEKNSDLQIWVRQRFTQIFLQEDKLVYMRGSFGFLHPNITWIEPKMRINPGIDPSEIRLYQQFFQELATKVKELQAT